MQKKIFLLGGYDLEMLTIHNILEENNELFFDKHLKWDNAIPEEYSDVFIEYGNKKENVIYGVELHSSEFTAQYANYVRIDHHNEFNDQPSALIQVAEILNKSLNRHQQLIAANDSGYIPAMEQLGATKEEIHKIRYLDRQVQGVTENDEQLAENAIKHHLIQYDKLTVVQSETSRFSAICDRLYPYNSLLIYNVDELMFYGKGTERVIEQFTKELDVGKFFYGGGHNGFAGIAANAYSFDEIKEMKERIIKMILNT